VRAAASIALPPRGWLLCCASRPAGPAACCFRCAGSPHWPSLTPIAAARCRSATPLDLYDSGVKFMGKHQPNAQVYFTGDFAEAGASSPCHGSAAATAQQQILDVIHYDWKTLKAAMPSGTKVFGSLGNHDSVPGDVYYGANDDGKGQQSWEYNNLTELWADDVGSASDPSIAQTIRRGGYYASRTAATGLTVVSLNINYWVVQNPEAAKPGSSAAAEGARMMSWLGTVLAAAEAKVRLPLVSWRPTHRRVRDCNSLFLSVSTFFACLLPARGMRSTSSATSHQPTEPGYLGTGTSSHGCAASTAPRSRGSFSVTFTSTSGPSLVRTAGSPRLLSIYMQVTVRNALMTPTHCVSACVRCGVQVPAGTAQPAAPRLSTRRPRVSNGAPVAETCTLAMSLVRASTVSARLFRRAGASMRR
jgi:hypothetical protein